MASGRKQIVILGGGFGGLYTARELEKKLGVDPDVEITLVNRDNFFLFTPMLHEVAASDLDPADILNPIRKLFEAISFFCRQCRSDRPRLQESQSLAWRGPTSA